MDTFSRAEFSPQGLLTAASEAEEKDGNSDGRALPEGSHLASLLLEQSPYSACLSRFFAAAETARVRQGEAVDKLGAYALATSEALAWTGRAVGNAENETQRALSTIEACLPARMEG